MNTATRQTRRKNIHALTPENLVPPNNDYNYFESAQENPFRPSATGFDPVNAAWLADASLLAYGLDGFIPARVAAANLPEVGVEVFDHVGTGCFVLHGPDFIITAFRGTQIDSPLNVLAQGIGLEIPAIVPPLLLPNLIDTDGDVVEVAEKLVGAPSAVDHAPIYYRCKVWNFV